MLTTMRSLGKWDELADVLRDEVAEFGGLLALLDEQRDAILGRDLDRLMGVNERVQEQTVCAERCRAIRDEVCVRLARGVGCNPDVTVRELSSYLPVEARALFDALIGETVHVVGSVKRKVERNAHLLSRAEDLNAKLLLAMRPASTSRTYNKRGGFFLKTERTVGGLDVSA